MEISLVPYFLCVSAPQPSLTAESRERGTRGRAVPQSPARPPREHWPPAGSRGPRTPPPHHFAFMSPSKIILSLAFRPYFQPFHLKAELPALSKMRSQSQLFSVNMSDTGATGLSPVATTSPRAPHLASGS